MAPSPSPSATYTPVGTKITGATSAAAGPLLPQPGQYVDDLVRGSADSGSFGSVRYYTVSLQRGVVAYFSATLITPQQPTDGTSADLSLSVSDLTQSSGCTLHDDEFDLEEGGLVAPISVAVSTAVVGTSDWGDGCPVRGTFVVKVTRTGDAYENQPLPLELGYRLEPPADTAGQPPAASPASDVPAQPSGAAHAIAAGDSFDNAPTLRAGTYQDTIVSGQTRYFRVPLAWGQRFAFIFTPSRVAANGGEGVYALVSVANPVRGPAGLASSTTTSTLDFGGDGGTLAGSTGAPVRYENRSADGDRVSAYGIAGDYFLTLSLGYGDNGARLRVPYSLAITVLGTAEPGPSYAASRIAGAEPAAGSGGGSGPLLWIVLVVAAVVGLVVVVLLLRRRSRRSGPGYAATTAVPARGQRQR